MVRFGDSRPGSRHGTQKRSCTRVFLGIWLTTWSVVDIKYTFLYKAYMMTYWSIYSKKTGWRARPRRGYQARTCREKGF